MIIDWFFQCTLVFSLYIFDNFFYDNSKSLTKFYNFLTQCNLTVAFIVYIFFLYTLLGYEESPKPQ